MRRLISPFQMITDHCFPSLDSLSHTFTHTHTVAHTSVSSIPTTNKFAHGTWKGESFSFGVLSIPASTNTRGHQHTEARGQSQGGRGRRFCLICPESETHSHPQWPFVATVSAGQTMPGHVHLSCEPDTDTVGASDEWDISPHLIQFFLISRANNPDVWNGWIRLSDGTQATRSTWRDKKKLFPTY